jgi:multidrug transporter EmrE-like cation transporter
LGWNALAKAAADKLAFVWLVLLGPGLVGLPLVILYACSPALEVSGLASMLASGVIHTFYFWVLMAAYDEGDLSFVYPYCRAVGAVLATFAGMACLGERPSVLGFVGIGLTIFATALESLIRHPQHRVATRTWVLTGLTGAAIGGYLFVDKIGIAHVPTTTYLLGILTPSVFLLAPHALAGRRIRIELRQSWARPLGAAIFLCASYGVVLIAMRITTVAYVVSARASGIIVSALSGRVFFAETIRPIRWVALGLTVVGIVCIALA